MMRRNHRNDNQANATCPHSRMTDDLSIPDVNPIGIERRKWVGLSQSQSDGAAAGRVRVAAVFQFEVGGRRFTGQRAGFLAHRGARQIIGGRRMAVKPREAMLYPHSLSSACRHVSWTGMATRIRAS